MVATTFATTVPPSPDTLQIVDFSGWGPVATVVAALVAITGVIISTVIQRRTGRETTIQASRSADAADRASKASDKSADAAQVSAASSDRSSKASERSVEVTERIAREVAERAQADALAKRYQDAATQLGHDKASIRLAGVYAMAQLADDWVEQRQTCIDVLCGYLRMSYLQYSGDSINSGEPLTWAHDREVRHTIIRVIAQHLQGTANPSWIGYNFDFTGAVFDGGDFGGSVFKGGLVRFGYSQFIPSSSNQPNFDRRAERLDFRGALFDGASVHFGFARISGATIDFRGAEFHSDTVDFGVVEMTGGRLFFGRHDSDGAKVTGGRIYFGGAVLAGGVVDFSNAILESGSVDFGHARFEGAAVDLASAQLRGGEIDLRGIVVVRNPPVEGPPRSGLHTV
jgi:hypothetical protein